MASIVKGKEIRLFSYRECEGSCKQEQSFNSTACNGEESNLQRMKNGDDIKNCSRAISTVDGVVCYKIPALDGCTRQIDDGHQTLLYSKKKCIDWMSRIPEEAIPNPLLKSSSKFELSSHQRKRWIAHDDTHECYTINGKKFFKSKSDLSRRMTDQMNLNYQIDEEILCNSLMKSPLIVSKKEIESTILEVLDRMGEEKLQTLMQSVENADVNNDDEYVGNDSIKTSNIVPECEQHFIKSPHPMRKYSVTEKEIGYTEKNYIKIKTDIFSASTEERDNHVGEIDISVQYLIITNRLKITIESLNLQNYNDVRNVFVNVSLEEGMRIRMGKRTKHVRGGKKCITYNQNVFFENVDIDNVHLHCLRFQVFTKPAFFLKKNKCVGECFIYLDNCDVVGKVKVCKKLISCE